MIIYSLYYDRFELDIFDETIRIQNFHFSWKLWISCWTLPILLRYRKAYCFQTIRDIDPTSITTLIAWYPFQKSVEIASISRISKISLNKLFPEHLLKRKLEKNEKTLSKCAGNYRGNRGSTPSLWNFQEIVT